MKHSANNVRGTEKSIEHGSQTQKQVEGKILRSRSTENSKSLYVEY